MKDNGEYMGKKEKKNEYYTLKRLREEFGFSRDFINKNFPEPELKKNPHYGKAAPMKIWDAGVVNRTLKKKVVVNELERIEKRKTRQKKTLEKKKENENRIRFKLMEYTPDSMIEASRYLDRKFVIHYGPTNSGKTYDALEALKKSDDGVYLGPLRLLALEVFDKLNDALVRCSLLTGEEFEDIPGANITASTIEMCNYTKRYKVAVIDEAQMICDKDRGPHWLKAICLVNAETVHICTAPEALDLVINLAKDIGLQYELIEHKRFVPLKFTGHCRGLEEIRENDAIITFSRNNVLSLAAHLEKRNIKASVIYGALPPASRREEVRRYVSGETSVVVATDAIGMGISLPIKRIVFAETSKFDGEVRRELTYTEIKQIAGRAGRYGMFDLGEVSSMVDDYHIEAGLEGEAVKLTKLTVSFPIELVEDEKVPLKTILNLWSQLPSSNSFARENVSDALILLPHIQKNVNKYKLSHKYVYDLITCPVNTQKDALIEYWSDCANAIITGKKVPRPYFGTSSLIDCELQYSAYDIYHQILRRIGVEVIMDKEKEEVSKRINKLLLNEKNNYIRRCRYCGITLPLSYEYNICKRCHDFRGFYRY